MGVPRNIDNLSKFNMKNNIGEDRINMHWSYLSIIALNIYEYTKAVYGKDYERMFDSLSNIECLASPRFRREDSKNLHKEIEQKLLFIELNMPKIIEKNRYGRPSQVNLDLQWKVTNTLRWCFKNLLVILEKETMLTFESKNPGAVMSSFGSS